MCTAHLPAFMYWNNPFGGDTSDACRTASSVASATFWRMRGEVEQQGTEAPKAPIHKFCA